MNLSFPAKAAAWWRTRSLTQRWRVVLGILLVVLAVWLAVAPKPWIITEGLGDKIRVRHYAAIGFWWAGLLSAVVLGALIVLCPWWARPVAPTALAPRLTTPRWFWPGVLVAMIIAGVFAFPRLSFSFWDDEEMTVRYSIAGRFSQTGPPGEVRFKAVTWQDTFFDYRTPNNHVLFSLLSRASSDVWRASVSPHGLPFSETAIRLPAFLFGILAVAALAWFLLDLSLPVAGLTAAFLAAIHPWFIRYASEARGYSMVLCLVPILFVFWRRAVTSGAWKWWAAFAATEFALIYTYPGTFFLLAVLNVLTIPVLAFSRQSAQPFLAQSGRWFCANTFAALPAFFLIFPLLPQAKLYFADDAARGVRLGWDWIERALSYLLMGIPKAGAGPAYPCLDNLLENAPLATWAFILTVLGLSLIGVGWFFRRGWLTASLALVILTTPVMTFGLSQWRQFMLYEPYIIYALPGLAAFAAVGLFVLASSLRRLPGGSLAVPLFAVLGVLGYFFTTTTARSWLVQHPIQQIRDSVQLSRGTLDPYAPNQDATLTASFCIPPYLYDAHMIRPDSADELIALMHKADREGKSLVLNIGMPWAARDYNPKMWALFNRPELFAGHKTLRGLDSGLDRIVATYRPGGAVSFDFAPFQGGDR